MILKRIYCSHEKSGLAYNGCESRRQAKQDERQRGRRDEGTGTGTYEMSPDATHEQGHKESDMTTNARRTFTARINGATFRTHASSWDACMATLRRRFSDARDVWAVEHIERRGVRVTRVAA